MEMTAELAQLGSLQSTVKIGYGKYQIFLFLLKLLLIPLYDDVWD